MKIRPLGADLFRTDRRTDGQTDMTKRIVAFRNFAKAAKIKSIGRSCFHLSRDSSLCCNVCRQSSVRIVCLT